MSSDQDLSQARRTHGEDEPGGFTRATNEGVLHPEQNGRLHTGGQKL